MAPGEELDALARIIQSGGPTTALTVACYFIWRAEKRLSRIEKALDLFLQSVSSAPTLVKIRERLRADVDG